jgi:hypothetical protein
VKCLPLEQAGQWEGSPGAAQEAALSHTPDCSRQAVMKSACPGWSSGHEVSSSWSLEVEDPVEGMLLGLTCKADGNKHTCFTDGRYQCVPYSRFSNLNTQRVIHPLDSRSGYMS